MSQGEWSIEGPSSIRLKTSRIGLMAFHAHAPVTDGAIRIADGDVELEFAVAIDQVATGNPLIDPEVHALVKAQSDGRLRFRGSGADLESLTGTASAGTITVPLDLAAQRKSGAQGSDDLTITGRTSFTDIHVPIPGIGHIKHIEIDIEGMLTLMGRAADAG